MEVPVCRGLGDDLVHEGQEIRAGFGGGGCAVDVPGGNVQRRKHVECAMALVGTFEAPDDFSAVGLHVTARPLQRLNARFLVHANHERVGRGRQIEPDKIGGFGHELRIGANAPGTLPLQANPLLPQNPPYRVWRNAQAPGHGTTIPDRLSRGGDSSKTPRICSRKSGGNCRGAPGRGRSSSPASPPAAKRSRHLMTVLGRVLSARANSMTPRPSRHPKIMRARNTFLCNSVWLLLRCSRILRVFSSQVSCCIL